MLSLHDSMLFCSKKKAAGGSQAATVVLETLQHLEKFKAVKPKDVDNFVKKLQDNSLELTDREKLHLINLCPTVSRLFSPSQVYKVNYTDSILYFPYSRLVLAHFSSVGGNVILKQVVFLTKGPFDFFGLFEGRAAHKANQSLFFLRKQTYEK